MKSKVLLCVPFLYAHKYHIPHLMEFYAQNKTRHDMDLHWEMGRPLHVVQGNAVRRARDDGFTHILYTEHDQWAYPKEGLDMLLDAGKDVIGLMTYMKGYPYLPMCMKKIDPEVSFISDQRNLTTFQPTEVISKTDLITWAFTLVNMAVFDRMKEAGVDPFERDGPNPTDSWFCQHCEDLDIDRWVHAGYVVNHGEHPKENVIFMRRAYDAMNAHNGRYHKSALIPAQNDEDPHGVALYTTEALRFIEENGDKEKLKQQMREELTI